MTTPTFRTTRWSLVARATGDDHAAAARALGELCELYWYPLYAFLRRTGRADVDAMDVVQSFCGELLEHGAIHGAAAQRGPFRHYLLGALRHFSANASRHARAQKRGGGALQWSLDDAAERFAAEPAARGTPEQEFARRWAEALLARAMQRLRDEYAERGRGEVLTALEPALLGDDAAVPHAAVAARLGTTEGAVKVALHRLRARTGELIRAEIAETLDDPAAVEDELRELFAALAAK